MKQEYHKDTCNSPKRALLNYANFNGKCPPRMLLFTTFRGHSYSMFLSRRSPEAEPKAVSFKLPRPRYAKYDLEITWLGGDLLRIRPGNLRLRNNFAAGDWRSALLQSRVQPPFAPSLSCAQEDWFCRKAAHRPVSQLFRNTPRWLVEPCSVLKKK